VLHGLPPAHLAIALLLLAAMIGGGLWAALKARRRPKPRGIRVDLVGAGAESGSDKSGLTPD
jgi:hypothetical protein